jgi:hypothetical protein
MSFPADGAPSLATDRGADQTLFICPWLFRQVIIRPHPSFFDRLTATFFDPPQVWWLVEDEDNTLSLTAVASGSDIDTEVPAQDEFSGTAADDEGGSNDISPP